MIDPAILRRPVGKRLFNAIKKDQLTMNRFEVSVKHELSLVSVRFALQAHNYEQFRDLVKRGIVFESGNVGERIIKARKAVNDFDVDDEPITLNFTVKT